MLQTYLRYGVRALVLLCAIPVLLEIYVRSNEPRATRQLSPKAANELRVFAYGESTVAGAPLPAVGLVKQLEHWLTRLYPERRVTVVNHGAPGAEPQEIAATVARTVDQRPDVVILLMGHDLFLNRSRPSALMGLARGAALFRRAHAHGATSPRRWPRELVPCERGPAFQARIAAFERSLGESVELAERSGARVILATAPSNLRDWPPAHRRLARRDADERAHYEATIEAIRGLVAGGLHSDAAGRIGNALVRYPLDAMLLYQLGQTRLARGDDGLARRLFAEAKERDPFPWRALDAVNEITRKVAAERGARLVDAVRLFDARAEHGVPGFDLLADNCHPSPRGNGIIAEALAAEILEIVPPRDAAGVRGGCCDHEAFLAAIGFRGSPAEVRYLIENGAYSMKAPFFDLRTARSYFERARSVSPESSEAWESLATISLLEGKREQGKAEHERAAALGP